MGLERNDYIILTENGNIYITQPIFDGILVFFYIDKRMIKMNKYSVLSETKNL